MKADASGPLAARLAARGAAWPAPLAWLSVVDSTNRWLKAAAREGAVAWSTVVAEEQTAGRGRRGRRWLSPRGNLHLSVLAVPPTGIGTQSLGLMPLLTGVALVQALETWGVDVRLKWPNDVRVKGRKLAGILVEGVTVGGAARLVVGIGVNVNAIPEQGRVGEIGLAATSLRELLGREIAVVEVAAAVLGQLATCYDAPGAGQPARIVADWRRVAEDWWGRPVRGRLPAGELVEGFVRDIAPTGALVIEEAGGRRREILAAEIEGFGLAGGDEA
jgi:BirA family biotin operon repressor/biotin-[acetyl-CoA-carboxylase] ligase